MKYKDATILTSIMCLFYCILSGVLVVHTALWVLKWTGQSALNTKTFAVILSLWIAAFFLLSYFYHHRYSHSVQQQAACALKDMTNSYEWVSLPFITSKKQRFRSEYMLNALTRHPMIYRRIYDNMEPSSRTLAFTSRLNVCGGGNQRIRKVIENIYGRDNLPADESLATEEIVLPVAFSPRGVLINRLRLYNSDGERIVPISRKDFAREVLFILESLFEICDRDLSSSWHKTKNDYETILINNDMVTDSVITSNVVDFLKRAECSKKLKLQNETWKSLISLVKALDSTYVKCVRCRMGRSPLFTVRVESRLLLEYQYHDYLTIIPNHSAFSWLSHLKRHFNALINFFLKGSGTFYIDLSRANLADSYHLMMLGPEGTYCAMVKRVLDRCGLCANEDGVMIQPSVGQRHAYIHVRNAKGYQHMRFVFHYVERPPDLYFASALLVGVCCLALLVACNSCLRASNSDVPALLLLAVSGVCPWFYDQSRNDRTTSSWHDIALIITIVTSIIGVLLFLNYSGNTKLDSVGFDLWLFLIATTGAVALTLARMSIIHASLYRRQKTSRCKCILGGAPGTRNDTPKGWEVSTGMASWEDTL